MTTGTRKTASSVFRRCTPRCVVVVSMLVVLPALCVRAFSWRGVYGPGVVVTSWLGWRTLEIDSTQWQGSRTILGSASQAFVGDGSEPPAVYLDDGKERAGRLDQKNGDSPSFLDLLWGKSPGFFSEKGEAETLSENICASGNDDCDESDALELARTARGGARGWWIPGQRARRRRNIARAAERAAAKRAAVVGDGGKLPTGLANQGNTCYLNSLVQAMYHAPGLKEAVLERAGGGDGVTLQALANVFRQLDEGGNRPASTLSLTRAMGVDPRIQQDAQEFGRFLFMALEGEGGNSKAKKGDTGDDGLSGAINELFAGRLVNYIECVNVPFAKEGEEVFYDLPLDVKGSGTLPKSLDRFTEVELMAGENRWRAGEHGLQEARKGVRFIALPPVLQFHLKRFEYDPYRDDLAKIHDRFEFPMDLDMSPWLTTASAPPPSSASGGGRRYAASNSPGSSTTADPLSLSVDGSSEPSSERSSRYHLSAIVMHVGGPSAGHYYAYVRNTTPPSVSDVGNVGAGVGAAGRKGGEGTTRWIKLDDQRVKEVSEAEVLRDAFGGGGGVYGGPGGGGGVGIQGLLGQTGGTAGRGGTASAYMLQYVRDEMPPAEPSSVPETPIDTKSESAQP